MASKLEDWITANRDRLGNDFGRGVIDGPTILSMLQGNQIRFGETDNALAVEIDGETYLLPDSLRLDKFRPA